MKRQILKLVAGARANADYDAWEQLGSPSSVRMPVRCPAVDVSFYWTDLPR